MLPARSSLFSRSFPHSRLLPSSLSVVASSIEPTRTRHTPRIFCSPLLGMLWILHTSTHFHPHAVRCELRCGAPPLTLFYRRASGGSGSAERRTERAERTALRTAGPPLSRWNGMPCVCMFWVAVASVVVVDVCDTGMRCHMKSEPFSSLGQNMLKRSCFQSKIYSSTACMMKRLSRQTFRHRALKTGSQQNGFMPIYLPTKPFQKSETVSIAKQVRKKEPASKFLAFI